MPKQHESNSYDKQPDGQKEHVCREDVVIFAGDRNFVRADSERWTSSSSSWRPSLRMDAAWDDWLHSIGDAYEVPQPEFTWGRVNADQSEHATWIYEIIDVVGSNRKFYSPNALRSSARRGRDLPHPRISDHWPVVLRWSGMKTRQIHQTTSSKDPYQRGCLKTWNSNVLQMSVSTRGLQRE